VYPAICRSRSKSRGGGGSRFSTGKATAPFIVNSRDSYHVSAVQPRSCAGIRHGRSSLSVDAVASVVVVSDVWSRMVLKLGTSAYRGGGSSNMHDVLRTCGCTSELLSLTLVRSTVQKEGSLTRRLARYHFCSRNNGRLCDLGQEGIQSYLLYLLAAYPHLANYSQGKGLHTFWYPFQAR
jgi:hypothetical protein